MTDNKGIVMVYTGDGKGKSTAAMGLALRAAGHDQKVFIVQFMKAQFSGEIEALRRYVPGVHVLRSGRDVFIDPGNPEDVDIELAKEAFAQAALAVQGEYDLVIMDEINVAIDFGLLSEAALLDLLAKRQPHVSVVLTGRNASKAIMEVADLVSEVKEVRHHWRKGIPAQPGIEF